MHNQRQVLKRAFPGVLLVPDICGLQRLPKVRAWTLPQCQQLPAIGVNNQHPCRHIQVSRTP